MFQFSWHLLLSWKYFHFCMKCNPFSFHQQKTTYPTFFQHFHRQNMSVFDFRQLLSPERAWYWIQGSWLSTENYDCSFLKRKALFITEKGLKNINHYIYSENWWWIIHILPLTFSASLRSTLTHFTDSNSFLSKSWGGGS